MTVVIEQLLFLLFVTLNLSLRLPLAICCAYLSLYVIDLIYFIISDNLLKLPVGWLNRNYTVEHI